ncbi:hypothetical protein PISMIDRAFT_681138 [Pisolithus microcarpus 441]|uniref:Uncharacterized protein n=1 Tax=Pisolithus microcarpus 441 TaxID=765257 RepID=A0A0C9Y9U8_9AGAM|nr:hypothetical protein BKA83DRAFT_681138 [Pisolithus microcarpus]KIK21455.1 hypothetical protein PISMIDRAFT_681138 [Pisolithus microcarpus 441]
MNFFRTGTRRGTLQTRPQSPPRRSQENGQNELLFFSLQTTGAVLIALLKRRFGLTGDVCVWYDERMNDDVKVLRSHARHLMDTGSKRISGYLSSEARSTCSSKEVVPCI